MLAIVAAVLFAIALVLALAGVALGPLDVIVFMVAGLLCLALKLAGVGMVAAVLFAIALVLALAGVALGPLDVIVFMAAGLLCLALKLAGVGPGSASSQRQPPLKRDDIPADSQVTFVPIVGVSVVERVTWVMTRRSRQAPGESRRSHPD